MIVEIEAAAGMRPLERSSGAIASYVTVAL
jgi:hypothetical protein